MKQDEKNIDDRKDSVLRFQIIFAVLVVAGIYVLGKGLQTMLPPRSQYWEEVEKRFTKEDIPIPASRGNILDCNDELLAGTLPEYRLYMDFKVVDNDSARRVKLQNWRDSMFYAKLDSISEGLSKIFPDYSKAEHKKRLEKGKKRGGWSFMVYPKFASYVQYKQCKELPLFKERAGKGGFHEESILKRKKPYGQLAYRTLGDLYTDSAAAKCGLELSFDSILRGTPGKSHRTKIRNKWLSIVDKPAENGHDLRTTIDIQMQDQADRALRSKLHEIDAEVGVAVVMEVKTGDVKAIVNLTRGADGNYYEMKNNAVSDLWEPGSTFKTASIMVALEDGKVTKNDSVDTGNGIYTMYRRHMKDHNWRKGGYGWLSLTKILGYSSNIGVSRIIDQAYHDNPDRFVRGLNNLGVGLELNLPFVGKGEARVRHPKKQGRYWLNWSNTALPWMSIGYETMLTPMNTLTFYNAIANNGRMVKPRFITAELKDGVVVREFPTEVIKEKICKTSTLTDIQDILEKVVSEGLGKKAGNNGKYFKVSGKTGTAQIAGPGGYQTRRYMVSFCGYFPSDAPQYSCIVCIVKKGLPASGGGQAGPVFSEISQYIMSKGDFKEIASDSTSVFVPQVSKGRPEFTSELLEELEISEENVGLAAKDTLAKDAVPDVRGMGARDAVYRMQTLGLKVKLTGKGRVASQSIAPGTKEVKGKTITLNLE
jgi:cell division protein FtsI (penicillin-binding protein 3)